MIVVPALVALVIVDVWLFFVHGFGSELVIVLTDPVLLSALIAFRALLGAVARRYSASAGHPSPAPASDAGADADDLLERVVAAQLLREAADHAEQLRQEAQDKAIAQLDLARQIYEAEAAEAAAMRERADHQAADLVGAARRQLDLAFELKVKAQRQLDDDQWPSSVLVLPPRPGPAPSRSSVERPAPPVPPPRLLASRRPPVAPLEVAGMHHAGDACARAHRRIATCDYRSRVLLCGWSPG